MVEKNLNQRLLIIGLVLLVGIVFLGNPYERLRPGLDIAGGTSLIFEIDDTGMQDTTGLAESVKTLLQKRVDPQGVYNLTWRVHGTNRIEVQMPLPPEDARERPRLQDCRICHESRAEFCDRCHEAVNLTPDCWNCHDYP